MHQAATIQDLIHNHYDSLSEQLQRAAKYVVEHSDEVATRSLRQLAGISKLSPPTYSRLARAVGCDHYEELRDLCRNEMKRRKISFADKARALQHPADADTSQGVFVARQAAAAIDNIDTLLNTIDTNRLELLAERLANARQVFLVGAMSSRGFVDYMAYMASMALSNWHLLGTGATQVGTGLAEANCKDVLLVITKSPYARSSVEAAKLASNNKLYVAAITDGVDSPVALFADMTFLVTVESPQFFSSHVATLVLIEALMGMIVARSGSPTGQRITAVERANRELGAYWPE
ncbi:MAG: MurR/RpiR family transcriptional regulator [Candidatus Azotimanducaceae bacterium WSBS_2022_MAG_OTU7]